MPVKTIDIFALLAVSITSSSLIEPPGWITDFTPNSIAASNPSEKGKKASYAMTQPSLNLSSCIFS